MLSIKNNPSQPPSDSVMVSDSDKVLINQVQRKFVELCLSCAPTSGAFRRTRVVKALGEFISLCQHPLIDQVVVVDASLIFTTHMISIQRHPIGKYTICVSPGAEQEVSCFNNHPISSAEDKTLYHGPHVIGNDGELCIRGADQTILKYNIKSGSLKDAAFLILDALQQTSGTPYMSLGDWLSLKKELKHGST